MEKEIESPKSYLTAREVATKWNISIWTLNYYLNNSRIEGAIKPKGRWLIPESAEKPVDRRTYLGASERKAHKKYKKRAKSKSS